MLCLWSPVNTSAIEVEVAKKEDEVNNADSEWKGDLGAQARLNLIHLLELIFVHL